MIVGLNRTMRGFGSISSHRRRSALACAPWADKCVCPYEEISSSIIQNWSRFTNPKNQGRV